MQMIPIPGTPSNLFMATITIASGAAESEIFTLQGMALIGIFIPSSGWTAAAIGYKTCVSGNVGKLVNAYDNSGNLEQTLVSTDLAAIGGYISIPQSDTLFVPWMQLTSRTAGTDTPVNQAAARTIGLLFRVYLS